MCVTPEMAAEWLKNNSLNRPLRRMVVEAYKREMLAGRWKLTHQGIAFDPQMNILDGQHRLTAIKECGVSVWMLVTLNVESEARLVIDDHAKRDYADAIRLGRGLEGIDSRVVGVLRMLVENLCTKPTKAELAEVFIACAEPVKFFEELIHTKESGIGSAPACAALISAWFYEQNLDRLQLFASLLKHGMPPGYSEEDVVASVARDKLINKTWSVFGRVQRLDTYKRVQLAIQLFMLGHKKTRMTRPETTIYPWPVDDKKAIRTGKDCGKAQRAIFSPKGSGDE
jgi:hypothetical protein